MIELTNVDVKREGRKVLTHLNFSIETGRIIMVLGQNGCGKTTLMKALLQLLPYEGSITLDGTQLRTMKATSCARYFSYLPQIKEPVSDMLVQDCVVSGCTRFLSIFAVPKSCYYDEATHIMERLGIVHLIGKKMHKLSGGEQQMVYVARAILQHAEVLLMDEPCTYLDFEKQYVFLEQIKNLKAEGHTIFMSMHDPNLALQYGDDILFLKDGNLYATFHKEDPCFEEKLCEVYQKLYGNVFQLDKKNHILVHTS